VRDAKLATSYSVPVVQDAHETFDLVSFQRVEDRAEKIGGLPGKQVDDGPVLIRCVFARMIALMAHTQEDSAGGAFDKNISGVTAAARFLLRFNIEFSYRCGNSQASL
jgi:hypothetical protein